VRSTAFDRERGIEIALHELHGVQELREAFERVVLALNRDDDAVAAVSMFSVRRPSERRAVDDHVAVSSRRFPQSLAHPPFSPGALIDELELGTDEVLRRGTTSR